MLVILHSSPPSPAAVIAAADPPWLAASHRASWWLLLGVAGVAAAGFVFAVTQRLVYPHDLEWMEGALADQAWRVANGLPLYVEPGPEYVPLLYAPLLSWLGALGILAGLDGIFALRLVAVLSTAACAAVIARWVRIETQRALPGAVAAGVFVAGYGWLAWWYDLARTDSLFVAGCLSAAFVLRHGSGRRWLLAAGLATAAVLAKQTAVVWLLLVGAGVLGQDWRTALRYLAAWGGAVSIAGGALHLASDGWSTFYLLTMPAHHGVGSDRGLAFWTEDLVPVYPLLLLAAFLLVSHCRHRRWRDALPLAGFVAGGLAASWLSRLHLGGFDNVMMYGLAGLAVVGPISAASPALRQVGPLLLLVQFGLFANAAYQRDPTRTLLPSSAHRRAHDELAAFVAAQTGPVWLLSHGYVGVRAQRGSGAHGQAMLDVFGMLPPDAHGIPDFTALVERGKLATLLPRARLALTGLVDDTIAALRERRYAALVFEGVAEQAFVSIFGAGLAGDDGRLGTADDTYLRQEQPLLTEPTALQALVGCAVHSPQAWLRRP